MFYLLSICLFGVMYGLPTVTNNSFGTYRGHKLISVTANEARQVELLRQLERDDTELDFWNEPMIGRPTNFRVPPNAIGKVLSNLKKAKLKWRILNNNIQQSIEVEQRLNAAAKGISFDFRDEFLTFSEIEQVLQRFKQEYKTVELYVHGKTYYNLPLYHVKVSKNDGKKRPAIWIESLAHAREWIAGSVALNIIDKLAAGKETNAVTMLDKFDWYIRSVQNPDGYTVSHRPFNRLWRKNVTPTNSMYCPGVDLNRNWDVYWEETVKNPCSNGYGGPSAFSELETKSLRDAINETDNVVAFFSFHSFSQLLFIPYGHGKSLPDNVNQLYKMAKTAMRAQTNIGGNRYIVGVSVGLMYAAQGSAYDYVMMHQHVPFSFTYELRPDVRSSYGFLLPPDQIRPTLNETFASLSSFAMQISDALTEK